MGRDYDKFNYNACSVNSKFCGLLYFVVHELNA